MAQVHQDKLIQQEGSYMAKILVVDDASIIRDMIKLLLMDGGHEVVAEAGSGQEAFELYKKHQPDLVTMDINMPVGGNERERGGILTLKKILSEFPLAKVVMVSSHADKETLLESVKAGAKHYLLKPISQDKLLAAVEKVLGAGEAAKQG